MSGSTAPHSPVLGSLVSPDGKTTVIIGNYDGSYPKNIASRGLGCCGFRALGYAARLQNVPELVDLPEKLVAAGIQGGAYPDKIDRICAKFGGTQKWWQNTAKDDKIIESSINSQRPVCVDYNGHDPHYHATIAHCVTVIAFDRANNWVAILDNNFPGKDQIVWLGLAELRERWHGWSYGLLAKRPGDLTTKDNGGRQWASLGSRSPISPTNLPPLRMADK